MHVPHGSQLEVWLLRRAVKLLYIAESRMKQLEQAVEQEVRWHSPIILKEPISDPYT